MSDLAEPRREYIPPEVRRIAILRAENADLERQLAEAERHTEQWRRGYQQTVAEGSSVLEQYEEANAHLEAAEDTLEEQHQRLAEAQAQISRMVDGGACPRRDPNGECVELNEAIAARDEARKSAAQAWQWYNREAATAGELIHAASERDEAVAREVRYRGALEVCAEQLRRVQHRGYHGVVAADGPGIEQHGSVEDSDVAAERQARAALAPAQGKGKA